jgi:hypothetical protein
MAYNFTPLQYSPYQYQNQLGQQPTSDSDQWLADQRNEQRGQFQNYTGNQFQSLFDAVNTMGENPMMTGQAYNDVPSYSPFESTREDFTTGGDPTTLSRRVYDPSMAEYVSQQYQSTTPVVFDQKGYLDGQFKSINDYLGRMGSFFGNMGQGRNQSDAEVIANAPGQGPMPTMPSIGMNQNFGAGANTSANKPFQSFGLNSGGWGTAPTSLFGAGANANNT